MGGSQLCLQVETQEGEGTRLKNMRWLYAALALFFMVMSVEGATDCCHVAGHCEWRGSHVFLDNYYCCPSGGHASADSAAQMGAGTETRPTLIADTVKDTYTCNCGTINQVCTHTPSPQGHVTMLPTDTSATRKLS